MCRYLACVLMLSANWVSASGAEQGETLRSPLVLPSPTYYLTSLQNHPPLPSYQLPPRYIAPNLPSYEQTVIASAWTSQEPQWVLLSPLYCLRWPYQDMPVEEWKNDGSIVAVINLNGGACAHELFEIFSQWGEVQQVELEMRSEEDAVRGIALIKFRQVESAEEVAKKMQGFEYNNAPLEIHPATVLVVGRDVFEVKDEEWVEAQGCSEE